MKILRLLNNFLEAILSKSENSKATPVSTDTIKTDSIEEPIPEKYIPTEPPPREWEHLHTEKTYRLIVPPEAFSPYADESAFMCTVIQDSHSGESRLIPYINIPIMIRTITEIHTTSAMAEHKQEWEFDLETQ